MISKKITIIDVIIKILELEKNTQLTVKDLKKEIERYWPDGEPGKDKWISETIFDLPANLKRMEDAGVLNINRTVNFDFWELELRTAGSLKYLLMLGFQGKL